MPHARMHPWHLTQSRYARIAVTHAERPAGAQLAYATNDPALVTAIHSWFDRKLMDHGDPVAG